MRPVLALVFAGAILPVAPALADDVDLPLMLSQPPIRLALAPAYHLKPADVAVPADARPGAIARMIRPFGPWTLICDDDFDAGRRVCMASQTLVDDSEHLVFSWSLAGSDGAGPVLIVRAPHGAGGPQTIDVAFTGSDRRSVALRDCDAAVCLGYLPIDAGIARAIKAQANVVVRTNGAPLIATTLSGLDAALASLQPGDDRSTSRVAPTSRLLRKHLGD